MELEEYKKMYEELKKHKTIIANIDTEFFFKFTDKLLQALDNSIPKEKVLKKMDELSDTTKVEDFSYPVYRYTMNVLEDLLGEYKGYDIVTTFREMVRQAPIDLKKWRN